MEQPEFLSTIAAVIVANVLTISALFGFLRIVKKDEWDWYSAGAIIFSCGVGLLVFYNAG